MKKAQFEKILQGAVAGKHEDLERILELYAPLIKKHAFDGDKVDEDLQQYLLIHIALNINKFPM